MILQAKVHIYFGIDNNLLAKICLLLMTFRMLIHLLIKKYILKDYERKRIGIACGEEP